MKNMIAVAAVVLLCSTGALRAQNNSTSTYLKGQWTNIRDLLVKMADRMPEENYRFKPTPEMQDFGERMAHVITFNMRGCSAIKGEQKPLMFSMPPTKAEVMAAMKTTNDECDSVFNSLTDADLGKMIGLGRGAPRSEFAVIEGLILEHSQEVYGYTAVYMRLKGIVPPSSDKNEK